MDYIKLYQYYQTSKLTDVQITINDGINNLQLKVHKLILSLSAPFFEKQFAFSTEDKIILNVENAFVANDLIMLFYGKQTNCDNLENWFHILKTFQLRDYFGLQNNIDLLSNLKIPSIGFDLYLEVCELVGFNNDIIKTINKNLPNDYDCFKLSNDLLNAMIKLENYYKIISADFCSVKIWNMKTGNLINTLNGHTNEVKNVAVSSDNKLIVCADGDGHIILWNADTCELIYQFIGHLDSVLCISFSPNNDLIVSGSNDTSIKVWNVQTGKLVKELIGHYDLIRSVIFSPNNQFIVSGSDDHTIKIWNATNYQLINTVKVSEYVLSLSISLDSKKIVFGCTNGIIQIWNIINGQLIKSFKSHNGRSIYCVQFSPNNNLIISCSGDKKIKIWDANDYQLIRTLEGHTDCINSVNFSPDSKFIISGSDDGRIKIWNADNYQLINTISNTNHYKVNNVVISNICDTTLSKKLKKYV